MISMNNTKIRLKIKTIDSNVTTIETSSTSTVLSLKETIRTAINIPVTNQKLIYQGKVLKDNDKLIDYKIEDNVVIHLVKIEHRSEMSNSIRNVENSTNSDNNSILTYLSLLSMLNSNNSFSLLNILTNRNQSQSNIDISDAFSHLSSPETFDLYSSYENICQNVNNIKIILSNTNKSNIMDNEIFELLKRAYQRAQEIGEDKIAKAIYQLVYDNTDWWERDEDEYERIMDN